jgi:hypothetical protein
MLKWLSEESRLFVIAIIFATMVTAQAQSRSNKPIILTVKPDLSLSVGSDVVTRHSLVAALKAATGFGPCSHAMPHQRMTQMNARILITVIVIGGMLGRRRLNSWSDVSKLGSFLAG